MQASESKRALSCPYFVSITAKLFVDGRIVFEKTLLSESESRPGTSILYLISLHGYGPRTKDAARWAAGELIHKSFTLAVGGGSLHARTEKRLISLCRE